MRVLFKMFDHQLRDAARFKRIGARVLSFAAYIKTIDFFKRNAARSASNRVRPGKSDEIRFVKMPVGKRDQLFVAAAIMPQQHFVGQAHRRAFVQNAFVNVADFAFFVVFVIRCAAEKARRRQLFAVADNDKLRAAHNCADGVFGTNLRRFIENYQIEAHFIGLQKLRDRKRTHQQTRFERLQNVRNFAENRAQRFVSRFLERFFLQQCHFSRSHHARTRTILRQSRRETRTHRTQNRDIEYSKTRDFVVVNFAHETRQTRHISLRLVEPQRPETSPEHAFDLRRGGFSVQRSAPKIGQATSSTRCLQTLPGEPVVDFTQTCDALFKTTGHIGKQSVGARPRLNLQIGKNRLRKNPVVVSVAVESLQRLAQFFDDTAQRIARRFFGGDGNGLVGQGVGGKPVEYSM